MKCLVCDFGGSAVKYALVDDQAQIEKEGICPAPLNSIDQYVGTVRQLYQKFCRDVEGVAISMPGYINPENGYLFGSGAYTKLYGSSIMELLQNCCPVHIAVENDGKCAALAEAWKGALSDCPNGAAIVLGSGIAGGIIKDGKIHSGRDFAAGELSYLITDAAKTNEMGCAVMSVGMLGLTYRMCKAKNIDLSVQDSAPVLAWIDSRVQMPYAAPQAELVQIKADGIQMFKWLEEGDAEIERIYRNFLATLVVVVHSVQLCYAPDKIAIGGGLSLQERIFRDLDEELQRYYERLQLDSQLRATVVKSRYLKECNLIGAMYNYMQRFGNC